MADLIEFAATLDELRLKADQSQVPDKIEELKAAITPLALVEIIASKPLEKSHVADAVFGRIRSALSGGK